MHCLLRRGLLCSSAKATTEKLMTHGNKFEAWLGGKMNRGSVGESSLTNSNLAMEPPLHWWKICSTRVYIGKNPRKKFVKMRHSCFFCNKMLQVALCKNPGFFYCMSQTTDHNRFPFERDDKRAFFLVIFVTYTRNFFRLDEKHLTWELVRTFFFFRQRVYETTTEAVKSRPKSLETKMLHV